MTLRWGEARSNRAHWAKNSEDSLPERGFGTCLEDSSAIGQGRTVLFVSHNMASVRALCNHGVLLENGMKTYKQAA